MNPSQNNQQNPYQPVPNEDPSDPAPQQGSDHSNQNADNFYYGQNAPQSSNATGSNVPQYSRGQTLLDIQEIERNLDRGWYRCYSIWLYIITAVAILDLVHTIFLVIALDKFSGYVISMIAAIWAIIQSVVEIYAISKKDLMLANRGLVMMVMFAVLNIVMIILVAIWYDDIRSKFRLNMNTIYMQAYLESLIWEYGIFLLIHLVFTMFGAVAVRNLLVKRQKLLDVIQ